MTALLTGVVMMLVVCHTPKAVMNIYESYQVEAANCEQVRVKQIYILSWLFVNNGP